MSIKNNKRRWTPTNQPARLPTKSHNQESTTGRLRKEATGGQLVNGVSANVVRVVPGLIFNVVVVVGGEWRWCLFLASSHLPS